MGLGTTPVTAGTTSQTITLPLNCVAVLLRCPSTNTANVNVVINGGSAGANNTTIQSGESVTISCENYLIWKAILGMEIDNSDYFRTLSYYSSTASQTLWIDALSFSK